MKLENKYIVLKRDKLNHFFEISRMARAAASSFERGYFDPVCFIDAQELESFLNHIMAMQGNDYFVMNLDEPAAQDAMERYFHYHDSDTVPKV